MAKSPRHPVSDHDRVTSDEVDALRSRLAVGQDEPAGKERLDGALTTKDIAEALGVSPEVVERQLDTLRAERAFSRRSPRKVSQKTLLGLAILLIAVAGSIYILTPKPLSEEEIASPVVRRTSGKTHFPIRARFDLGPDAPPTGFHVEMVGRLTVCEATGDSRAPLPTATEARERLQRSMEALFAKAVTAERDAPTPPAAFQPDTLDGIEPAGDAIGFVISAGNRSAKGYLRLIPEGTAGREQMMELEKQSIERAAGGFVGSLSETQEFSLADQVSHDGIIMPPCGYSVAMEGRRTSTLPGGPILLGPVDGSAVARRLLSTMTAMLHHDQDIPPDLPEELRARLEKTPIPAWTTVTIRGPVEAISFKLPTGPSSELPTAVDVRRAANALLVENALQASKQVRGIGGLHPQPHG